MAGSVEIAFENEFVEIQHVNASDRKCNSFFFGFRVIFSLYCCFRISQGKGRQDYILSAFEKLAFCFSVFLCLWKSVWCILIITEIEAFHCFQRRLSILKMKKAQRNKTSHRNSFHCIKTEALWNWVLEVSISSASVGSTRNWQYCPFRQAPGFSETGIDTELPFGLVLEKFSSQVIQSLELFQSFRVRQVVSSHGFLMPFTFGKIPF